MTSYYFQKVVYDVNTPSGSVRLAMKVRSNPSENGTSTRGPGELIASSRHRGGGSVHSVRKRRAAQLGAGDELNGRLAIH